MLFKCALLKVCQNLNNILFIFFLILLLFTHQSCCDKCSYESNDNPLRIKNLLPDKYLAISPPERSHPVYIGIEILDINAINDAKNYFSLELYLFEVWTDSRLDTSLIDEQSISIPEEYYTCLWTPSLEFESSTRMEDMISPHSIISVLKTNVLIRKSRYSFKVSCHMHLQIYPMDRHHCHFTVRTFSDPIEKVSLKWIENMSPTGNLLDSENKTSVIRKSEFTPSLFNIKLRGYGTDTKTWFGRNYTILNVEFIFERTITANILTVYIPSSLVVTLSWIQFWFDVEAVPGRMSLGIMSTLTIMTQILTNYEKAANHVTAVDIWLLVCLIMVFLALMEYAIAYTISHYFEIDGHLKAKNSFRKNMSLVMREIRNNKQIECKDKNRQKQNQVNDDNNYFRKVTDKVISFQENQNKENSEERPNKTTFPEVVDSINSMIKSFKEINTKLEAKCECNRHLNVVDYISRYAFPLVFVLFALIYWILLTHFYDSS